MADIPLSRIGELLRNVFELLWNRPEGMTAREILAVLPEMAQLTEHERGYSVLTRMPRYERIIRLATIPLAKAGWLVKSARGRWYITEPGREACRRFPNAQELYREALRLFEAVRQDAPGIEMTVEEAQENAWEQIQKYLLRAVDQEFQELVADLLYALGYHVAWSAPPQKTRGQIDMVAHVDPVGAEGRRILVQVKHRGETTTVEDLNAFLALLRSNDYALLISRNGFTVDVRNELRNDAFQATTLWDLEAFADLWIRYYDQLKPEAQRRLPLKAIHFLHGVGEL